MMRDEDCIFCKIVRREISSKIVRETDDLLVFTDVNPMAPTHLLIIPKLHVSSVNDLEPSHGELVGKMMLCAKDLAAQEQIDESGFRLVMNTGKEAGQSVFHLHLHLLGGRAMHWPPG